MPSNVPPPGHTPPPIPDQPSSTSKQAKQAADAATPRQTLNDLLSQCSPEEKRKFFDLLIQNLSRQIKKDQDKIVKQMRKIREHPENPDALD